MGHLNQIISVITLNINALNTPIKNRDCEIGKKATLSIQYMLFKIITFGRRGP